MINYAQNNKINYKNLFLKMINLNSKNFIDSNKISDIFKIYNNNKYSFLNENIILLYLILMNN